MGSDLPEPPKDHWITIDPGLNGSGFAVFASHKPRPVSTGVVRSSKRDGNNIENLGERAFEIACELTEPCSEFGCVLLVCEWPQFWASSASSYAGIASGKLFRLAYLVGAIVDNALHRVPTVMTRLITPGQWKGQLPKKAVIHRIGWVLGKSYEVRDHEADAVGMGLTILGEM